MNLKGAEDASAVEFIKGSALSLDDEVLFPQCLRSSSLKYSPAFDTGEIMNGSMQARTVNPRDFDVTTNEKDRHPADSVI